MCVCPRARDRARASARRVRGGVAEHLHAVHAVKHAFQVLHRQLSNPAPHHLPQPETVSESASQPAPAPLPRPYPLVCACVCARARRACVCMYVCARASRACVCCVCCVCVCVCLYVCVRARVTLCLSARARSRAVVCACACVRAREHPAERAGWSGAGRVGGWRYPRAVPRGALRSRAAPPAVQPRHTGPSPL